MQQNIRQRVARMTLHLEYADGMTADFTGSDLIADVLVTTPELPSLDVQDIAPYRIASPEASKVIIEITRDLKGTITMQTHPPRLRWVNRDEQDR